ncbi:cytochrome P450 [Alcaligenaceae bacterium CGII-47]|nr:cytochrome P450 [Alcaligenaceae bacterium CGII-47]
MTARAHWDPRSPEFLDDPIGAYDALRQRCPVAQSAALHLSVFGHADTLRILMDPDTFSSQASRRVSVPNSMDPPEHSAYRKIIEPYFNAERMTQFAPRLQALSRDLVARLPVDAEIDIMATLAYPFALQTLCGFLGWPDSVHEPLYQWIHKKNAATQSGEHAALALVATEFDSTIRNLLAARRKAGDQVPDDATTRLMNEQVGARALNETEIVSILRNWTVGELGTMAASVGIIANYLATHASLQQKLRDTPSLIDAANNEILRIHAPLLANRRRTTQAVCLGDTNLEAGERVSVLWVSANRDPSVFENPDEFRLGRNPKLNLLYGAGIHACPGAPLARMALESIISVLLAQTQQITPSSTRAPTHNAYPAGGYSQAPIHITRNHKVPDDLRPTEPEEPGLNDCCGNGCEPCVFDTYIVEKRQWEQDIKAWDARQASRPASSPSANQADEDLAPPVSQTGR